MRIIIFFLIFFHSAFADIVIVNLNRNSSTVRAAKKAAAKRGEKVIVIPKGKTMNRENFEQYMKDLDSQGVEVSSMVFSGHDGGGNFSGHDGEISKYDVYESMKKYPKVAENVKSLVLRGCYTATPDEVFGLNYDEAWRNTFPNLNMVAGYLGGAPSSEKKESTSFIEEILSLETELYLEESVRDIEKKFANISNSTYTTNAISFRTCHDDEFKYLERSLQRKGFGAMNEDELKKLCSEEEFLKKSRSYKKVLLCSRRF